MKKIVISVFIVFYPLYLYFNFYNNENIYSKTIYIDTNSVKILKINNKLIRKSIYEYNTYNIEDSGIYNIYYDDNGNYLGYSNSIFNNIRNKFRNILRKKLSNEAYNLAKAIFLNEKSNMSYKLKQKMKQLSISHLFALSGLHLSIIYMLIDKLLFFINDKYKYILQMILISIYCLTISFMPSITRAYIMLMINTFSKRFYNSIDSKIVFYYTLALTILYNPFQITDISYLISYISCFIIIYFKNYNIILKNIILQLILTPITYIYFNQINLFSFLINIIAINLFNILVYLLLLNIILPINIVDKALNMYIISIYGLIGL